MKGERILVQATFQAELESADILFMSLKELGISPSVNSFDDRKRVQKVAYIIQQSGVRLNYRYSWYLHGPYSSELTSDLYQIATQPGDFANRTQGRSFVPEIQDRVVKLRAILAPIMEDTQLLEAVASILYIGTGWRKIIGDVKPRLDKKVLDKAHEIVQKLGQNGLIDKSQID